MTPEDRAAQLWFEISALLPAAPKSWSVVMLNTACTAMIVQTINRAINDKLEEVAREIEALESGTYTTAQTPAGLVRAMKVK